MTRPDLAPPHAADRLARSLLHAAAAGADVLAAFVADETLSRERKADGSYVTEADLRSDAAVRMALATSLPDVPVVSEESAPPADAGRAFILVDPLDGTADFLRQGSEFAVAVAYVEHGRPRAGAIIAPRLGRAWWGGTSAWQARFLPGVAAATDWEAAAAPLRARDCAPAEAHALVSRLHGDPRSARALEAFAPASAVPCSSAVKFGLIAAGEAQLHIRCGPTMEWDVAAGDAILSAAGGSIVGLDGLALVYGRPGTDFRNPPFIASAGPRTRAAALAAVQRVS